MRSPKVLITIVLVAALTFAGGFGLAKALSADSAGPAAQAQADIYSQVLRDLQHDYYRPVDLSRLGHAGVDGLIKPLNDPYTVYFTPQQAKLFSDQLSGSYSGIGVVMDKKPLGAAVLQVLPGSPAARAGIKPGDVIVSVNGRPTAPEAVDVIASQVLGPAGSQVKLQIKRPGTPGLMDLTLTREKLKFPLTSSRLIVDHGTKVGYVRLTTFASGAGDQVRKDILRLRKQGATRFILDLRDNGGGLVTEAVSVAGDFLPDNTVVVTTRGLHSPLEVLRTSGAPATRLPLAVLVNGNTASASEIVSGALQDYRRATLIGSRTFGKGVVQEVLPLPGGASLKITVAAYRTPKGRDINKVGISPNIVVTATPAPHGKPAPSGTADPALQRALGFLLAGP